MNTITSKKIAQDIVVSILFGLGIFGIASPFLLWWFIHGDYDRYIWIIHGPFPFSGFGSGPFQFFMYAGLLFCGILLIVVSLFLKGIVLKELVSIPNPYFQIIRWLIILALAGILGLFLLSWIGSLRSTRLQKIYLPSISKDEAIAAVKQLHPELQNYPSDNLPPTSIDAQGFPEGWYLAFIQNGSGRPILSAQCFKVTIYKEVILTGKYEPLPGQDKQTIAPIDCK